MGVKSRYDISHLIGQKFGRVTVTNDLGIRKGVRWVMGQCECGKLREFRFPYLRAGHTKSCGCFGRENLKKIGLQKKHGKKQHPIYHMWERIKARCYNPKTPCYSRYGGIGVTVCDEWRNDFPKFYDWAINNGWEKGLVIDKDKLSPTRTGKCYCPEYCCFLTVAENNIHRASVAWVNYKGKEDALINICRELSLPPHTIYSRYKKGWSVEKCIETPIKIGGSR